MGGWWDESIPCALGKELKLDTPLVIGHNNYMATMNEFTYRNRHNGNEIIIVGGALVTGLYAYDLQPWNMIAESGWPTRYRWVHGLEGRDGTVFYADDWQTVA